MKETIAVINTEGLARTVQEILSPEVQSASKDCYAIIGTREPDEAQELIAKTLAFAIAVIKGKIVRTGGANGIDTKVMEATGGRNLEVYLPWNSYNRSSIPVGAHISVYNPNIHRAWLDSVRIYHPNYDRLSHGATLLHARNYGIVGGCKGVVALPGEDGGGGTGQGIRIAKGLKIPLLQANKGTITDAPRWCGKALQQLGLADKDLQVTLSGG